MSGNVKITGVPTTPGPDGAVPLRWEIRDLQTSSPDQFNLFLLGIRAFQAMDEEKLTSYYQIAGIHGMPFKAWDNVQGIDDWTFGGYCTHSSVLFLTWHRPYLALFEQVLYNVVHDIAQKFPSNLKDRYVTAAKTFRLPYYDWAEKPPGSSPAFPSAISSPKISVVDTDGATKKIDNPLYQFTFHPINPQPGDFDDQWSQYPKTVRYPDSNGNSRDSRVTRVLANENASLRTNVSLILLSYTDFDAFSNNEWVSGQPVGTFGSLEDVHNEIHDKTGGNGHMSVLETSAFDPLFWLHHCNVDRLWAIWQDLNPNSFITAKPAPVSTFSTERGTTESASSPLTPFWDTTGTEFWTSSQVKESSVFGYAYPETQRWKYSSDDAYRTALRTAVTRLYGGNVFQNFAQNIAPQQLALNVKASGLGPASAADGKQAVIKDAAGGASGKAGASELGAPSHGVGKSATSHPGAPKADDGGNDEAAEPIPSALAHLAPDNVYTEWIVNVRALKHGLGQTFRVIVFLGDFTFDPEEWDLEFNVVGRVTVLGRSATTQCGKCRHDADDGLVVTGTVPLTSALLQDIAGGQLASLDERDVVPYLRDHLQWRVTQIDGEAKDARDVPGLKVSVASTKARIGADGVPVFSGEYTVHKTITEGKPAGLGDNEEA